MNYQLEPATRAEFDAFFSKGALLKYIRNEDYWRIWSELRRDRNTLDLSHGSGAVARLTLDSDERIVAATLLEGDTARALVREHAAPLPPKAEREARKRLRTGVAVDDAIQALGTALSRRFTLYDRLALGDDAESVWRVSPEGSAVQITESPAGTIARHCWLAHGDAIDAFERLKDHRKWDVPEYAGGRRQARTLTEALFFLRTQRADLLDRRDHPSGQTDLVANTPEGRRVFAFTINDRYADAPLDFGPGLSQCLDPVMFYHFAAQIEDLLPRDRSRVTADRQPLYAADLRLAATAADQALRFIPWDQQAAPASCYLGAFNAKVAERRAEQLSRAGFTAQRDRLFALAETWQSGCP